MLKDKSKLLFLIGSRGNKEEETRYKYEVDGGVENIPDGIDLLTVYSCAQGHV